MTYFNFCIFSSHSLFIKRFFLMWIIFKVLIEFVTILLLFYVLVFCPWGMWDLNSPTREWTYTSYTGRQTLNHWTTMEVPIFFILLLFSWSPTHGLAMITFNFVFHFAEFIIWFPFWQKKVEIWFYFPFSPR